MNSGTSTLQNHHNSNNYKKGVNTAYDYINSHNINGNIKFSNILKKENKSRYNRGFINTYRKSMKKGGGALPLRYFDPMAEHPSANPGYDLLGSDVRPRIGGKRSNKKHTRKRRTTKKMKGGFIPSIMEPFVLGCSKYIAPLAAFSGYRLMHGKKTRQQKRKA